LELQWVELPNPGQVDDAPRDAFMDTLPIAVCNLATQRSYSLVEGSIEDGQRLWVERMQGNVIAWHRQNSIAMPGYNTPVVNPLN
jgi:hypothetical protein